MDTSGEPDAYFKDSKYRWPEAIPMLRAWRFDPSPLASEVFENGNLPPHAQTQAVPLSKADEQAILSLNWVKVELPQTEERQRQQQRSNALSAHPTKPGPVVSPGTRMITVSDKDKAWTYAARFGTSSIWKIGQTNDLKGRIQELNAHVPVEHLKEEWRIAWHHEWRSTEEAQEMEQCVLTILSDKRTQGERLRCSEKELEGAWVRAIAEPLPQ